MLELPYVAADVTVGYSIKASIILELYSVDSIIMSTPLGGGHIIFAFSAVRRPASHLVSRHFRQQFLSYLYQIWHAGLLG